MELAALGRGTNDDPSVRSAWNDHIPGIVFDRASDFGGESLAFRSLARIDGLLGAHWYFGAHREPVRLGGDVGDGRVVMLLVNRVRRYGSRWRAGRGRTRRRGGTGRCRRTGRRRRWWGGGSRVAII